MHPAFTVAEIEVVIDNKSCNGINYTGYLHKGAAGFFQFQARLMGSGFE